MLIIPIRTESEIRRTPSVNILLIGLNILLFGLMGESPLTEQLATWKTQYLVFQSDTPTVVQFFTYQFLHADIWHLLGNMLFLWVFGNSVNSKMGDLPYLLFYLSSGVFAAWVYGMLTPGPSHLLGASGAIASVTTAYLVLFPRSKVTVMVWLFFIYFFQVQAMIIIGVKVIVWDNIIAPSLGGQDSVAQSAHLAGYFFGFVCALGLLLIRAIPRDQFDILALWKRWNQRRAMAAALPNPDAAARAQFGSVAQIESLDPAQQKLEDEKLDAIDKIRTQITEALDVGNVEDACKHYGELLDINDEQCLSENQQLTVARHYYSSQQFIKAANAFERFIEIYAYTLEAENIRLLLGIMYARDLKQYAQADKHLMRCMKTLKDEGRRQQCAAWLGQVRALLGDAKPEQS